MKSVEDKVRGRERVRKKTRKMSKEDKCRISHSVRRPLIVCSIHYVHKNLTKFTIIMQEEVFMYSSHLTFLILLVLFHYYSSSFGHISPYVATAEMDRETETMK